MKKLLLTIHIPIALGLLGTGYAAYLNPVTCGIIALAGYLFPVFLALSILSLAIATLTYKRQLVIPVVALIAAYQPVTLYIPYNKTQDTPEEAITIMTYNTHSWGTGSTAATTPEDADGGRKVMRYIANSKADIVCLQESQTYGNMGLLADSILTPHYKYRDTARHTNDAQLCILSKYPITRKQHIDYPSKANSSAAFWIDINGKEIIVINNHLESTGLSIEERNQFSDMIHGKNDTIKDISKNIFSKLLDATRIRVPQAKAIATFIRSHHNDNNTTPIIVCGDFNDIPHSYVHHTIADNLTDCYQATATGPGFSFSKYGMRVRIDNVLCTTDITPYNFRTDQTITTSDHYPIIGKLLLPR